MAKKRKHGVKRAPLKGIVPVASRQPAGSSAPQAAPAAPPDRASLRAGVRFLVVAVVLMGLLYGVYYFPYAEESLPARALNALLHAQGHAAAWLIGLFEDGVSAHQGNIQGRFPMRVVKACSSLDAQALFAGTVLAFPSGFRAKMVGLAIGGCALTGLNIARIAGLYFVGLHAPQAFDAVHEEVLPMVLVAAACVAFAAWASWARVRAI